MNIPIILYGDDGTLLKSIETQHGRITVARTVQDFSEALGMAHTGIARVLLCVRVPSEVSASMVDSLAQSEVLLAVIAPENLPLPTEVHRIPHRCRVGRDSGLHRTSCRRGPRAAS